ncbi:TPA: virulence protein [Klebsiella aerogenes]|nr:virulence protein [Klebsiella aerogenes]
MNTSQEVRQGLPSLPKGGGAITGMGEALSAGGPTSMVGLTLPLPAAVGRGYAPGLALSYQSSGGNGPFGMGWQAGTFSVSRSTHYGAPRYNDQDTFVGPDGEKLRVALTPGGLPDVRQATTLQGVDLGSTYTVTRYQPRIESSFSRIEWWSSDADPESDFWLISSADGQVHMLGRTAQARIASVTSGTARWLLEESLSPTGEHIYYQYQAEDDAGCSADELQAHPDAVVQRYLLRVYYGNITPRASLFVLDAPSPADAGWLYCQVFDYGERDESITAVPPFTPKTLWRCRADRFSDYAFGFEVRTRRLCRQVLAFARLQTLSGDAGGGDIPQLVQRLVLGYDETPSLSLLVSCRQLGHEPDGTPVALPPLELDYQRFSPEPVWHARPDLGNLNAWQPWQLVDLRGEGLSGVLYQDEGTWWYRAPVRDAGTNDPNAVTWGELTPLAHAPGARDTATLMDVNGDGRLEWLITRPGMQGSYSLPPEGEWTHFTPLSALPVEYFHPRMQLADVMGAGFSDLVLIGPRSVRLYASTRDGWAPGQTVTQSGGVTLPIPGADRRKLVAFSDLLGSGQQHLAEVSAVGVTCWPNLGHGRFGPPQTLPGFSPSPDTFDPDRVFLADIDGSGTVDVIYAHSHHLEIYCNQSGNGFAPPVDVPLPVGVCFDDTCRLQIADIQGLGVASMVLTVPHMAVQHWCCHLTTFKPWLLNAVNNNMGAHNSLHYRSSAQFWLDEKVAAGTRGETPVSCLPFPVHTLWRTETLDEITGNRLVSALSYAHGAWDGREREFRGFGRVQQLDTHETSAGTARERTAPARSCSWFATGLSAVDTRLAAEFWTGDGQAFPGYTPRFVRWDNETDQDVLLTPSEEERYWLERAMKGTLLRNELYGMDGTALETVPYSVSEQRVQVRLIASAESGKPIAWPTVLEQRSYLYERISVDPQCTQRVQLRSDAWGLSLQSVSIAYPRRARPATSPYPDTLPTSLFEDSYDDQQQSVRLTVQQNSWHHLTGTDSWRTGLADYTCSDVYVHDDSQVPPGGFTLENLTGEGSLIADSQPHVFAGQSRVYYTAGQGEVTIAIPTLQALVAFTETAVFDEASLLAYEGVISPAELEALLTAGGYQQVPRWPDGNADIWVARGGYTDYGNAQQFWRPLRQRSTLLTGVSTLTWDPHYCAVITSQDAAGLTARAEYDYRFLSPVRLTDVNNNVSHVTLDALGRPLTSRFWGTESGAAAGFSTPEVAPFTAPATIDEALALAPGIPVAQCITLVPDSWMPHLSERTVRTRTGDNGERWQALRRAGVVTEDGLVCTLALARWSAQVSVTERPVPQSDEPPLPPHTMTVSTDRFDADPAQQLRQSLTFSDGFGRVLQQSVRHVPGEAWKRGADGSLVTDAAGSPVVEQTDFRWAVSGRVEYDNKGLIVRTYQPYYLNDWRYVSDDSARDDAWADTHRYDPTDRLVQIITALGYLRQNQYFPWFSVAEDENDTLP